LGAKNQSGATSAATPVVANKVNDDLFPVTVQVNHRIKVLRISVVGWSLGVVSQKLSE
jgi:hypothetical protein